MQESNQYHERERAAASVMNKYAKRKAQSAKRKEQNKNAKRSAAYALRYALCAMLFTPCSMHRTEYVNDFETPLVRI